MSDVFHRATGLGGQYHLPGVGPSRLPAVTFSAQRYDPRRLPPALPLGDGATAHIFHDVEEMVVAAMPPALKSSLAFPPPRAVLSQNFTRQDSSAETRGGPETLARKVQRSYGYAGKFVRSAGRRIAACLRALKDALCGALRCACDATTRIVWPLIQEVRGRVPEWVPITRILLD